MKFLIIGSNGMVGHVVALYLRENSHEVLGYDEKASPFIPGTVGSLHDESTLRKIICENNFDAVVNCTAVINQYAEENKAEAAFINTYLPHFLEKVTEGTKTMVVHRSTDCVFSGAKGHYELNDIPDAKSFYARTKAVGEILNEKDLCIRVSLIGPEQNTEGISLLNWFLSQNGEVKGYMNAIWTGLTTIEFAKEIEFLVSHHAHGLLHCVPNEAISKYDLLILFEKYFPNDRNIIKIDNKRVDKSLVQSIGDYGMVVPSYESQIHEMVEWINQHKLLYPTYYYDNTK